jgi:hypothetical protein
VRNATNLRRDLELERQTLKVVCENDAVLQETMRRYSANQTQLALFRLFYAEKQVERVDCALEEISVRMLSEYEDGERYDAETKRHETQAMQKRSQIAQLDAHVSCLTDQLASACRTEAKCETQRGHAESLRLQLTETRSYCEAERGTRRNACSAATAKAASQRITVNTAAHGEFAE